MSGLEIMQSVPDDAREIGEIRAANWKEQFANLPGVTPDWLEAEIERVSGAEGTERRAHWIERALQPDAQNYWLSARVKGNTAIIGFLEARKHDNGTQELRSLHLAANQRGLGIGQAFMDRVQDEWFDPSAETYLYVAEANQDGQRFYRRHPNNYTLTECRFMYGAVAMRKMLRLPV